MFLFFFIFEPFYFIFISLAMNGFDMFWFLFLWICLFRLKIVAKEIFFFWKFFLSDQSKYTFTTLVGSEEVWERKREKWKMEKKKLKYKFPFHFSSYFSLQSTNRT